MRAVADHKKLLIFGVLAGTVIALFAFTPTIYALVEPHITINMDPGQTTKPFVINDDLGTEVFSIDVDGVISPPQATDDLKGIQVLSFEQGPEIETSNLGINNAVELAKWRIDFVTPPPLGENPAIRVIDAYVSVQLKTTNTQANSQFGFATSTDDTAWSKYVIRLGNQLSFKGSLTDRQGVLFDSISGNVGYISVRFFASDVSAPVQMQHGQSTMLIILPEGATITRII